MVKYHQMHNVECRRSDSGRTNYWGESERKGNPPPNPSANLVDKGT